MAQTASSILDIIAPQYKTDPDKNDFISFARAQTSTCFYSTNTEMAIALRAAHMLVLRDRAESGNSGEIASKREGDLAISFHKSSSSSPGGGDLGLTTYGQQLQGLRKGSGAFIGVLGGNDEGCDC